jgi:hypothetical protein
MGFALLNLSFLDGALSIIVCPFDFYLLVIVLPVNCNKEEKGKRKKEKKRL